MKLKSVYSLIVIFIFNKISLLSGKGIKTGNFQVLHQHPGIKNCAAAVLYQNELVGGRVSNVTGMCEGLPYLWGLNETIQSGYAYVKKISAQESFQPPIILGPQQPQKSWLIPGVLSAGAKVEVTLGGEILATEIWLIESSEMGLDTLSEERNRISIRILGMSTAESAVLTEQFNNEYVGTRVIEFLPQLGGRTIISFQIVQANTLKILIADEQMTTYSREGLDMKMMRQIRVLTHSKSALLRFEFTKG